MKLIAFKTWVVIIILGIIFALPVFAITEPEMLETRTNQVTEKVEDTKPKVNKKKKDCRKTSTCTVKQNPNKCNLSTHWMWPDGSCHKKQKTSQTSSPAPTVAPSGTCHDWMRQAGITDMQNAYTLIMRESGCNPNAVNASSGACGIGQQLPCGKWAHTWNDPIGGMKDMQIYVFARYGSWAQAVAFWDVHHWY